jgi:hypothetical protein
MLEGQFKQCRNCAALVDVKQTHCHNCGAFVSNQPPVIEADTHFWTPTPDPLLTQRRWLDFVLGYILSLGSMILVMRLAVPYLGIFPNVITFVALIFAYLAFGPRYPLFARGIGWGLISVPILIVIIALGALIVCFSSMSGGSHL